MMDSPFRNIDRAQAFMLGRDNLAVFAALSLLHGVVVTCCGIPISAVRFIRTSTLSMDLLWFYTAVEVVVEKWFLLEVADFTVRANTPDFFRDPRLPELGDDEMRQLMKFAILLDQIERPAPVDEAFCIWAFCEAIVLPKHLPKVLDGSLGRKLRELENADVDTILSLWE